MTKEEYAKLKETFPWSYLIDRGFVRVHDKNGQEIDLFTLLRLVVLLTTYLRVNKERRV